MANEKSSAVMASSDPLWNRRWWLLTSGLVVLAGLIGLKFELSLTFRWPLFVWGLVVGICGAVWINWFTSAAARPTDNPERLDRIRHRRIIYSWTWPFLGVDIGLDAALCDLPWLIIAVAGYFLALMVGSLVLLRRMNRQRGGS